MLEHYDITEIDAEAVAAALRKLQQGKGRSFQSGAVSYHVEWEGVRYGVKDVVGNAVEEFYGDECPDGFDIHSGGHAAPLLRKFQDQVGYRVIHEPVEKAGPAVRVTLAETEQGTDHMPRVRTLLQLQELDEQIRNGVDPLGQTAWSATLQKKRDALTVTLEPSTLRNYDRLRQKHPGKVVVPIQDGACSGCHMHLTTKTLLGIEDNGGMVECATCHRFLYRPTPKQSTEETTS